MRSRNAFSLRLRHIGAPLMDTRTALRFSLRGGEQRDGPPRAEL